MRNLVLSLPILLRLMLGAKPKLVTPVLQGLHRVITTHLLDQSELKFNEADTDAITLLQRFGSAATLNVHIHCPVLDGTYRRSTEVALGFMEVAAPTDEALQTMLHKTSPAQ